MTSRWPIVATLGSTQVLAWACSFYLPAVLAEPIARDLGLSSPWIYGALSFGMVISAFLGPSVGRLIDERGGRPVLCASNLLFAIGLALLSAATGPMSLFLAWLVLGIAMAAGLYEPAFAALAHLYGKDAHTPMTGITLIAGFASTIGWPVSAFLEHRFGWRGACLGWALLHLTLGLPFNAWALRVRSSTSASQSEYESVVPPTLRTQDPTDHRISILAFMFTASGIVGFGLAANLPGLFVATGASSAAAIAAASLLGPAQVAARVLEFSARRWSNPLTSARIANVLHPIGAVVLGVGGAPMLASFSIIHGAGNGILTIARGTLPLALFGPDGYGALIGRLSAPARLGQAIAPLLCGMAIAQWGVRMLLISSALSLAAFLSLFQLRMRLSTHPPDNNF